MGVSATPSGELGKFAAIGKRLWQADAFKAAFGLFRRSAGDMLDTWFESDPIKAMLGFDAVVGNLASPYTRGSAYVLLHHAFGEVNGKSGVWGHAIGGMGAITQAMARAAGAYGVRIDVHSAVREVIVKRGRAAGVVLADGTTGPRPCRHCQRQSAVPVRGAGAARGRSACGGETREEVESRVGHVPHECRAVAAAGFFRTPGTGDHHTAGIIMAPSLGYMDAAYRDCVRHGWSREPIIEMLIPSTLDDSLAPPGAHVASLFCQHVAPRLCRRLVMGRAPRRTSPT